MASCNFLYDQIIAVILTNLEIAPSPTLEQGDVDTGHRVVRRVINGIVPKPRLKHINVIARSCAQRIITKTAIESVISTVAVKRIIVDPTDHIVVIGATIQRVNASTAFKEIATCSAIECVVASATIQVIVTAIAIKDIFPVSGINGIVYILASLQFSIAKFSIQVNDFCQIPDIHIGPDFPRFQKPDFLNRSWPIDVEIIDATAADCIEIVYQDRIIGIFQAYIQMILIGPSITPIHIQVIWRYALTEFKNRRTRSCTVTRYDIVP